MIADLRAGVGTGEDEAFASGAMALVVEEATPPASPRVGSEKIS